MVALFVHIGFAWSICSYSSGLLKNIHEDVAKWKHFQCYWPFVRGIHRSALDTPHEGQNVELCFLWCAPEQTTEQTMEMLVIWDAMALIVTPLWCGKTSTKHNKARTVCIFHGIYCPSSKILLAFDEVISQIAKTLGSMSIRYRKRRIDI